MNEKNFETILNALAEKLDEKDVTNSILRYDLNRLKEKLKEAEETIADKDRYIAELEENARKGEF